MKKSSILFICLVVFSVFLVSCKKEELQPFKADPAINFTKVENSNTITYSFMTNPDNEYIQEIPVTIIGDTANVDRTFNVEVVSDSNTTATSGQYEILSGIVEAGKFTGNLRIKLIKSPDLDEKTVSLKLKLVNSPDFKIGNKESSDFVVKWTNQIVIPSWTYFRIFFVSVPSNSAYRLIIQVTGLTTLTAAQYGREIGAAGVEALATKFGDYVKQWNKDHPNDKLKHDSGTLEGQEIVPKYYTHSKFD